MRGNDMHRALKRLWPLLALVAAAGTAITVTGVRREVERRAASEAA